MLNCRKIIVEINSTRYISTFRFYDVRAGEIKDKLLPKHFGVGFIGNGPYIERHPAYSHWVGMLTRVYGVDRFSCYDGCSIHEQWHDFQNFAKWFNHQVYQKGWHLDKDLINRDCKLYSPDTCVFLPPKLNYFVRVPSSRTTDLPRGVKRAGKRFVAYCRDIHGNPVLVGSFADPATAHLAYMRFKKSVATDFAEAYKEIVADTAYQALLNYKVLI